MTRLLGCCAIAIALLVAPGLPDTAGAAICKRPFTVIGNQHTFKFQARKSAREIWEKQAGLKFGAAYKEIRQAIGRSYDCVKEGALFNWTCKVTARPCR